MFIVNLKKKFSFWRYTFYEFQGQSKGHKVKYLKITWNYILSAYLESLMNFL